MDETDGTTRRRFLGGAASAVAGSALLAGCSGSTADEETTTEAESAAGTDAASDTETAAAGDSYTVSMAPVGAVPFDAVPESIATYSPGYADMLVALGHADAVESVGVPSRYHTDVYGELDGVSVDKSGLTTLYDGGVGKETFYSIGADLHLIDPNWLLNNFDGWEQADIDEISTQVAPFFGNTIFRQTDAWHDYPYYTMYEAFGKVAEVVREQERYDAFRSLHDETISEVSSQLPPENERPSAALLWQSKNEPTSFYPYRVADEGTANKQFHDLGIGDAFAETGLKGLSTSDRGTVDYEALLEVDPPAILLRGHESKSATEFRETVLAFMQDHPVASELQAVKTEQVFRGGPIYTGPIQNLFLTERYAQAFYPDAFGEEQLFDRSKLASIVTGT